MRWWFSPLRVLVLLMAVAVPALRLSSLEQELRELSINGGVSPAVSNVFRPQPQQAVPFMPYNQAPAPFQEQPLSPALLQLAGVLGGGLQNHKHHHHHRHRQHVSNDLVQQLLLMQQQQVMAQNNPTLISLQQQLRDMINRQSVDQSYHHGKHGELAELHGGTPCQRKAVHQRRACGSKFACYVTECAMDGSFAARQCNPTNGYCWCVDHHGEEIDKTRMFGNKNGASLLETQCLKLRPAAPVLPAVSLIQEHTEAKVAPISTNIETIEADVEVKPNLQSLHSCDAFCQSHCSTSMDLQSCLSTCSQECSNKLK